MKMEIEALDDYFGYTEKGSSFENEIRAGIATFLTMAYILVVNPAMLALKAALRASSLACSSACRADLSSARRACCWERRATAAANESLPVLPPGEVSVRARATARATARVRDRFSSPCYHLVRSVLGLGLRLGRRLGSGSGIGSAPRAATHQLGVRP